MKKRELLLGIFLLSFLLLTIYLAFSQPLNVYPISVTHSFTPDEGYNIVNYTKGGQNATINFTLVMADWGDLEGNITEITFDLPNNVIFSDLENASNGTGLNDSLGDDWWCQSSTAGLDYYLNWSCYNATESQLGSNDEINIWFNFTANNTGTEEPIVWSITIVGNSSAQDANTTLWHTNLDAQAPRVGLDGDVVDFFNETATGFVVFNYTTNDSNLDTCELWGNWTIGWHLNETFINQSFGLTSGETNGSSNITIEDGRYVWSVYCNDSLGNSNTTVDNYTLTVDLTGPVVGLDNPVDYYNETATGSVVFNFTSNDSLSSLDTCELWGNWTTGGWHLNESYYTNLASGEPYNSSNVTIEDGQYVWSVYCNDTWNNWNTTVENRTLTVDITAPNITLDSPVDFFNETATGNVTFNYTASDVFSTGVNSLFEIDTCELWGNWTANGWHLNETFVSPPKDATNGSSNITIEDGLYVWTVYCNDTLGNNNNTNANYTLIVDLTSPSVTLDAPSDNSYDTDGDVNFSFTAVEANPDQCTLWFRSNATNWAQNDSTTYSNGIQANIFVNLTDAAYVWNVECNGTENNPTFASANRTLTVDTVVPVTPTVTEPSDTSINPRDSISYTCESSDVTAGISKWTWTLTKPDSTSVAKTGGEVVSNSQSFSGDETNLAGTYTVKCEAEDKGGLKSSSSKTFTVHYTTVVAGAGEGGGASADIDLSTTEETTITEKQGVISTFTLDGVTIHTLKIKEVDEVAGTVTIIIESDPIEITLKIGETKEVDIDGDGTNDISITLNKITKGIADITTKKLMPLPEKEVPTEEVPPAEKPAEEIPTAEATSKAWQWILIIGIIVVIGVGYWFIKKKYPNIFLKGPFPKR